MKIRIFYELYAIIMRHSLTIISTIFILAFCQTKNNSHADKFQLLLPDTTKTHRPNKTFKYLTVLSKQMNLPSLTQVLVGQNFDFGLQV